MRIVLAVTLGLSLASGAGRAPAAESALRLRASPMLLPCLTAAVRTFPEPVQPAPAAPPFREGADVWVLSAVEMTRVLESGRAEPGSERDLFRLPWVLSTMPGNPLGIRTLQDLARPELEVWVPASPAAYEALRVARGLAGPRVR